MADPGASLGSAYGLVLEGQARALQLASGGGSLEAVLDLLVRAAESQAGGRFQASILLLDEDGRHLRHGAAPSLPDAYNRAIDGIAIGPAVGSCGTAAFLGHAIFVTDIQRDPLWADYRALAQEHGLRACWSTPFHSRDTTVLGTLALYYREPRGPTEAEREIVKLVGSTAAMVVENARLASRLRDLSEGARVAAEAEGLGFFTWDLASDTVRWQNERPYEIFGIPRTDGPINAQRFVSDFLHEDDKAAFSEAVAGALRGGKSFHFLGRIRRKDDGALRWVEITGRLEAAPGRPPRVVGIAADVTSRHGAAQDASRPGTGS